MENQRKFILTHDQGDDYVLQIDNSSLETLTTCPRSAYFSLIEGRVAAARGPLEYGSAHHEGLEVYYKGGTIEEVKRAVLEAFTSDIEPGAWRTPESALESIGDYINHYKNETLVPKKDDQGLPMVEIPFSIPLGEVEIKAKLKFPCHKLSKEKYDSAEKFLYVNKITIFWTGKIDIIALIDHGDWVVDHKTSSIKGESYYADFELSHQTIGYTWAAEQILGKKVDGFLLNLIINRKPTKSGTKREFDRRRYYYPRYRIDEWPNDTLAIIDDLLRYLTVGYFPPMRKWCVGKYGKCRYHDTCCLPPDKRLDHLHSPTYVNNTWSPLD